MESMLYNTKGAVATIVLNRPEHLNAFRQREYDLLTQYLTDFEQDPALSVLVLTGTGRAFSAGQDLKELESDSNLGREELEARLEKIQQLTRLLVNSNKTSIASINGLAVGIALELALACDFRLASKDAYFMFAEARRGLFQTNGVLYLLPRLIGLAKAKEMLLTGDRFECAYALQCGLVNAAHDDKHLASETMELARQLSENSPVSLQLIQDALRNTYECSLEEMMEIEIQGNLEILASQDFEEGLRSFHEKRSADFLND